MRHHALARSLRRFRVLRLALALTAGLVSTAHAQESLGGTWEGALDAGGHTIRTVLHLTDAEGGVVGTLDSPEQNAFGLTLSEFTRDGAALSFRVPDAHAAWAGRYDAISGQLVGTWSQRGVKLALSLERMDVDPLVGTWQGTGRFGALELRIVFHVGTREDGSLGASMVSPDQSSAHIPAASVERDGDTVRIEVPSIGARYEGTLDAEAGRITGQLDQQGTTAALELERVGASTDPPRPQTPKPPFPYRSVDVAYDNPAAGNRLAGTLTLPSEGGPFPAVILITGSGQQDRNEELFGHKPFLVIADALTRHGIAVLRVDDRGVGGSTGDVLSATSEDFASDVGAGIDFLKARDDVRADQIGLVGHSEGGLIAPLVARKRDDVAFLVLLAGPGIPGDQILYLQADLIARAEGATDEAVAANRALQEQLFRILRETDDLGEVRERASKVLLSMDLPDPASQIAEISNRWFQYFVRFDPAPVLREVRCPVLALNGARDLQVPPKEDLAGIAKALEAGGNRDFEVRELPGLNHLFQHCETGAPSEYPKIEETFAPEALDAMTSWILAHTSAR